MDLFTSVFSGDGPSDNDGPSITEQHRDNGGASVPNLSNSSTGWSFGGLIKSLATKSESVIHNYRRDLEELGSGLKKETSVIREVASRAVRDLPTSLDVGTSVAQESLESVGQAIDDIGTAVWKSTSRILTHGRETLLAADSVSENYENNSNIVVSKQLGNRSSRNLELKRYNRFDAQLQSIQRDMNTYLEEPEDLEDYKNWKLGFVLEKKGEEIENLNEENEDIRDSYRKFVPNRIDRDLFWSRYFYRVDKLKQADEARTKLVNRTISTEEEEDLSWDFDDDDEQEESHKLQSKDDSKSNGVLNTKRKEDDNVESFKVGEITSHSHTTIAIPEDLSKITDDKLEASEKLAADGDDSCKDSDMSVISSQQPLSGEEELGWDEIEDIGIISESETKDDPSGSKRRFNLKKRLSVTEEDEDLSWDIEDEDDAAKLSS